MNAIQTLRAQAQANGALKDSKEQKVVVEKNTIQIVPADPQIVYVPQYDPQIVYVQQPVVQPQVVDADPNDDGGVYYPPVSNGFSNLISFGAGVALGAWAVNSVDWGHNRINVHNNYYYGNHNYYNNHGWWNGSHNYPHHGPVVYNQNNINNLNVNNINKNTWNQFNKNDQNLIQNNWNKMNPDSEFRQWRQRARPEAAGPGLGAVEKSRRQRQAGGRSGAKVAA